MTAKQRRFVAAIRQGEGLEDAAANVGYTIAYAQRLLNEPAIRAAIDAPDRPEPERPPLASPVEADPEQVLRDMISDGSLDERVRITAVRALASVTKPKEQASDIVIIDDIPLCDDCDRAEEMRAIKSEIWMANEGERLGNEV